MDEDLQSLLANNRAWAEQHTSDNPAYFSELAEQQRPQYLWIGCSDSRVPANEIVGMPPGSIFVHRNVANLVVHSDLNCLSVLQYAVEELKVSHVIVTGHYGCGGVAAAVDGKSHGLIDNWLRHIEDVADAHRSEIDALPGPARLARLCELNVIAQVRNVVRTTIVQRAWRNGQELAVHGWVYGLDDGLLRDLGVTVERPD